MAKPYHIAIDGPVAAGKGTISRLVAERLGFLYVDTGAMYRMTAYLANQQGVALDDEPALVTLITQAQMEMRNPSESEKDGRLSTVLLNGEDVSWKIRTEAISSATPHVARLPQVRAILVEKQQLIAQGQDVVMEGRDITYKVLPEADLKIFMTANDIVRAKRRHLQHQLRGVSAKFEDVYQDLLKRDQQDKERATDPLKIVDDAWVIDTSDLSISQVVDLIVGKVQVLRGTTS